MSKIRDWFRGARTAPAEPFPDQWASFLWNHSAHYRRLSRRLQTTFQHDIQRFMTTQRITGVETTVDDSLRLLVAASAVTLSAGWPGYKWNEVSEVLLYPDDFDRDYAIGRRELSGIAHVWGTVILSVPSLWHSFTYYDEAYHLGFHEFAHLLTYERGRPSTVPIGLSPERIQQWERIQANEVNRVVAGDSVIDQYGLQPSEFFPCTVEVFFQKPMELRAGHPHLYRFLARYFRQTPATWESRVRARLSAGNGA
jgi:hypothetical protein